GQNGFDGRFYSYGLNDLVGWDKDFFSSLYKTTLLHTVTGITDINFQYYDQPNAVPLYDNLFGYYTTYSNYTLELSGFYKAPVSGTFNFRLAADNGASLQFGSGQSCCDDASESVTGDFSIDTLGPYGGGGNTDINVNQASFSLTKGAYYPVKIVMFNWTGNTGLNLIVTDPVGNIVRNFGSQVFQATFDTKCYTTSTSVWGNTFTSTTTQSGGKTQTVVVEIPKATTTTTATWSHSFVSTSTATGTLSDTVIVEVPHSLTTTTSTWTGSHTETHTVTGSGTDTIVVDVPTPTQTVTSVWTGSYVTSTTVTGGPGKNNTVIVEVPHSLTTTTSTWTGSYTETHTVTGSDSDTIVVDVPTPTQTVTSVWTGDFSESVTGIVEIPSSSSSWQKPYSSGGWNSSYVPPTSTSTSDSFVETKVHSGSRVSSSFEITSSWASIFSSSSAIIVSEVTSPSVPHVRSSMSEAVTTASSFVTAVAIASSDTSNTDSSSATGSLSGMASASSEVSAAVPSDVTSEAPASSKISKIDSSSTASPVRSETRIPESSTSAETTSTLPSSDSGSTSSGHVTSTYGASKSQDHGTESSQSKQMTGSMFSQTESIKTTASSATPSSSESRNHETTSTGFVSVVTSETKPQPPQPATSSSTRSGVVDSASLSSLSVVSSQGGVPPVTRTDRVSTSFDSRTSSSVSQESSSVFCYRGVCVTSSAQSIVSQATPTAGKPISSVPSSSGSVTAEPLNSSAASTGPSVPEPSHYSVFEGGASKRSAISLAAVVPILAILF
ncbi:hypothetical protein OXX79_009810, partial [Metschnikowia pulcherrima]